jgi:hypothetical protein
VPLPSEPPAGGGPAPNRPGGPPTGGRLRTQGPADAADAAVFLGRLTALDPAALVRLRDGGDRVTGYARLPFGVLVSRTVAGAVEPADVTVGAAALLGVLDPTTREAGEVALPARRDVEWRVALPPLSGWQRLDEVPGSVVRSLVRAGAETLRALPAEAAASAGESLLDHEALTVSSAKRTVAVPLRVLTALAKMGFLGGWPSGPESGSSEAAGSRSSGPVSGGTGDPPAGPGTDLVVVSAAGGWVRLAAAYGSAYHHQQVGLGLSLR